MKKLLYPSVTLGSLLFIFFFSQQLNNSKELYLINEFKIKSPFKMLIFLVTLLLIIRLTFMYYHEAYFIL